MLARLESHPRPSDLRQRIDGAVTVTPALMADVVAQCPRAGRTKSATAARLWRLIDAEAWNDAALALVDLELPHWSVVRLVFDDGEWMCTLSPHPQLPTWLDGTVEAHHACMPLAILAAVLDACEARTTMDDKRIGGALTRGARCGFSDAVCCDNFA
jgi:hypothetical protein